LIGVPVPSPRESFELPDSATARTTTRRRKLGELLLEHGLLTDAQLVEALAAQHELHGGRRRRLGQVVVEKGFLTERQLAQALAELFGLELVDLSTMTLELGVARLLPRQVAERN